MLRMSRLTLFDGAVLLLAGAAVASVFWNPRAKDAPELRIRADLAATVILIDDKPRHPGTLASYIEWAAFDEFHGAFALGFDGRYSWSRGAITVAAAKGEALRRCGHPTCEIIAISVPDGSVGEGEIAISSTVRENFLSYLALGGHKAFAVSDGGWSGWAWDHRSEASARLRAIAECEEGEADSDGREAFVGTCRVISTSPRALVDPESYLR